MLSEHKGHHCQHRSDDFPTIANIITPHKPKTVVELGTDEGGFSGWLADLVEPWGGVVHTFDIKPKFKPSLPHDFRNLRFYRGDVLDGEDVVEKELPAADYEVGRGASYLYVPSCSSIIRRLLMCGPLLTNGSVLLYCDNGNKQKEIELYASSIPIGSLLATHDYNTEVMGSWVEPFVAQLGFVPEGHEKMEALRNEWYPEPMTRFWVRRSLGVR